MLYILFYLGPKCKVCHSPPPGAEVREEGNYNSTPPYVVMACARIILPLLVHIKKYMLLNELKLRWRSGFGDLDIACWLLVPKFAGSHPAEAVGFLGRKKS